MTKKKYDAVATIGKYKDREGNEKKRYMNVGTIFINDDGNLSMKLDGIPVGPEWSGWISFYEPKVKDRNSENKTEGPAKSSASEELDDDIPF